MKDAEDEAFEQLALKQGQWEHTSGWRKKQIMDKIEQAFPNPHRTDMGGMSLRDYFAAKALQGYISARGWHPDFVFPTDFNFDNGKRAADGVAVSAYKWADAMLKAR
jgi:hypothetical protein